MAFVSFVFEFLPLRFLSHSVASSLYEVMVVCLWKMIQNETSIEDTKEASKYVYNHQEGLNLGLKIGLQVCL